MAHQSLYRTYRPQTFDDVVGQTHITRTLRNAVAEGTVAHAYLFTGPRGTGKTTTARILAKALECERGPTPDPDGTCQECVDIAESRHPDVYELDAASRTGIDNVREEIIGRVAYAPTRGRWKIYIIDEVHMLSTPSFNALLKTIEEPPPNVMFVLCTTHPHKVPETIHSRCQRFDFRRIGVEDIAERLQIIADAEEIKVAEGSLTLIARHAAGGMRDAITTLEQLAAFTGNDITLDEVEGLLGEVDRALLFEAAEIIAGRDVPGSFRFVARLADSGADLTEFVHELTGHMRDVYVTNAIGDPTGVVDTTTQELARLTSQAALFGPDRLVRVLDVLGELASELRWSSDPRLVLEVGFMRLARPHGELSVEALAERIETLELKLQEGSAVAQTLAAPDVEPSAVADAEIPASEAATAQPAAQPPAARAPAGGAGGPIDRARVKRAWPSVIAEVRKQKAARASTFVSTDVDIDVDGVTLVIEFPRDEAFRMKIADEPETRELVSRSLGVVLGTTPPFRYQLGRGAVKPAEPGGVEPDAGGPSAAEPAVQNEATAMKPASDAPVLKTPVAGMPAADEPPDEVSGGAPEPDTATDASPPPAGSPSVPHQEGSDTTSEIERKLVEELGAQIVGEQVHEAPDWKDEQ